MTDAQLFAFVMLPLIIAAAAVVVAYSASHHPNT
jgi:hypothetical protein